MTNCLMNRPPRSARFPAVIREPIPRLSGAPVVRTNGVSIAASSPVRPAANRGATSDRRLFHDDEAGALKVLHQALGDDRRHHLTSVVRPLASAVAQGEG